ncbi:DNA polymerase III subunit gamma/tau [Candidatus Pseudothioglobus singularis]|uniref:DNA polymerase III subunit gamma/tau n=1 Tax=Candidatus Pseudothioglobus singularis PS1 TaxID=1125411 RepID=A0A0M4LPF2_9GAMM|nr:DNA polymerase III subunit gamma/tau [Candidatus Pseudothioglobus singularis]ALE01772.1 DNA polymerase III subunit gamma/tau [Candidatus Pseudothioglobus singularis PS1]
MSEHYEVLARKYRPHNFKELVGQTHTIRTLVNALDSDNLHHGFLFTGTRGVGKTTIARIFAKSVNCEEGVSSNPCGKCATCIEIDKGQSVDLIELDAASHTGVDHMREILDNAQYTPTKNLYKIYLIDEVHMLSKSSFNALLKTLEEPPSHIKFLLATTDPKKLPITILSRCLQFNLNKLSHDEILNHLKFVMNEENLKFDDNALSKIAEFGNGSMRDALSLLDQSISFGNGSVVEKDLKEMLGLVNHDEISNLASLVCDRDAEKILLFVKEMAHKGENLSNALKDLTSLFHKISIAQIINDEKQFSPELMDLANQFTAQDLQLYYQIAINGQKDMSLSPSEQIGLEMTLLRMITFHPNFEVGEKKTLDLNHSVSLKKSPSKDNSKASSTSSNKQSDISIKEVNHLDIKSQDGWEKIITQLDFNGAAKMLVKNTVFKSLIDQNLTLTLSEEFVNLHTTKTEGSIRNALHKIYPALVVMIEPGETNGSSLSQKESVKNKQIQKQTENQFLSDDGLQELQEVFKSQVDLKSIKSIKESDNV